MLMDYGALFTRAWNIIWNNKFLWVLGFLVALGSGGGGSSGRANFSVGQEELPGVITDLERLMATLAPMFVALACIAGLIGIVLWLLRLVSEAGLISAVARIDGGEQVTLGQAFSAGSGYLFSMVGLNLLLFLPLIVLLVIAFAVAAVGGGAGIAAAIAADDPTAMLGSMGIIIPCLCLALCLIAILSIVLGILYPFAQRGIVLRGLGVVESIRQAWRFVTQNLGQIILVWLGLFLIGLVIGAIVAAILLPLSALAVVPAIITATQGGEFGVVEVVTVVLGGLVVVFLAALFSSVFKSYQSALWTLVYQQLVGKEKVVPAVV
jgi:hypothetical protein